jgi:hypothetical protein
MGADPDHFDVREAKQALTFLRRRYGADVDRILGWIMEGSRPTPEDPHGAPLSLAAGDLLARTWKATRIPHVNLVLRPLVEAGVLRWTEEGVRFDPRVFPHAVELDLPRPSRSRA